MDDTFESFWELNHRSLPVEDPKALAKALYERPQEHPGDLSLIRELRAEVNNLREDIDLSHKTINSQDKQIIAQAREITKLAKERDAISHSLDAANFRANNAEHREGILQASYTRLRAENARLKGYLTRLSEIVTEAPELNMCNYNEEEVRDLNNAMIEAFQVIHEALPALAPTEQPASQDQKQATKMDAEQIHSPEPWVLTSQYCTHITAANGECVADVPEITGRQMPYRADRERIVACVNACAGMANPEQEITHLRSAIRAAIEQEGAR